MRRGFTGTTQKLSSSRLKRRAHHLHVQKRQDKFAQMWTALSLFFFRRSRNCAIWISSTRTHYKPPLLRWHLTASARKCAVKTTWKVEFGVMVCSPWQCTCSLFSVCEILGKDKLSCHTVLTRFSAAWLSFPRTQDGVTGTDNLMISLRVNQIAERIGRVSYSALHELLRPVESIKSHGD